MSIEASVSACHSAVINVGQTTRGRSITDWVRLIRAEYLEIPGLHLTRPQVLRLWGLDDLTCDALLGALIEAGFLRRTPSGGYVRADNGAH